jgi:poly(3-hydroxybutyrate) depolymerase
MRRLSLVFLALVAACTAACSSSSSDTSTTSGSAQADASGDAPVAGDAQSTGDAAQGDPYADIKAGPNTLVQDGAYHLGIFAKPFGLKLFFQLYVIGEGSPDKGGKFKVFEIRGFDNETKLPTEPLAVAYDVPVDATGAFAVDFKTITLPPKASPTGSEVPIILKLFGSLKGKQVMCGDVEGNVPQFFQDLKGSTWKAVPTSADAVKAGEAACETVAAKVYKHIEQCPAITVGAQKLTSAERERTFQVLLPASGTPTEPVPVVFLFHGVGGNAEGILKDSQFATLQAKHNFVLVVPESERGTDGKAVLKTDWYYGDSKYDMDNPDLVYFDDLLTCVGKNFKLDPARTYITGMSGGGLIGTFVGLHRSKVVAAAAPFSGGYLSGLTFPAESQKTPFMLSWGGEKDFAFSQDFNTLAGGLIAALSGHGNPLVQCNHGTGHKWPAELTPAAWSFLSAYTLGKDPQPWAKGLPPEFPGYCKLGK